MHNVGKLCPKIRFIMKLSLTVAIFQLTFIGVLFAGDVRGQDLNNLKIEINLNNSSVEESLIIFSRKSGIRISYADEMLQKENKKITLNSSSIAAGEALQKILEKTNLKYRLFKNYIVIDAKPVPQQPGSISGKVLDDKGAPLPGASIKVIETGGGMQVRVDGSYTLNLPAGTYTLEISYISFQTQQITGVIVTEGKKTPLDIAMKPDAQGLREVVITSSYKKASVEGLYARQKNNAAVTDGISADQISATPDNNAAQVLKRISGLTVQEDKFVTVRGLSDRYNNILLNGSALPSTEPNRRNFSFDIIPSALIDNIVVNKTATPDMSSEFAGGLVQVNLRDIPEQNFTSVTLGTGLNTNSSGKPFYSLKRGNRDYLGFDDGNRTWLNKEWKADQYRSLEAAGDYAGMSRMNARVPNRWGLYEYNYSPVQNYQLAIGRKYGLNASGSTLGFTLAGSYRHEETAQDEMRYQPGYYYFDNSSSYNFLTTIGTVASIGYKNLNHKLVFRNLYNRRFSNETNDYHGQDFNTIGGNVKFYTNTTIINTLLQNRLEGEHLLPGKLKLDWSADYINTNRDQPDTRSSNGYQFGGPDGYHLYVLNDQNGFMTEGLNIFNSRLKEDKKNIAVNLSVPFTIGEASQLFKLGYSGAFRNADFSSISLRTFYDRSGNPNEIADAVYGLADYQLQDLMQPGFLTYRLSSATGLGYNGEDYTGKQNLQAAYAMLDLKFLRKFRLIGGMRMERNNMEINGISFDKTTGDPVDSITRYKRTDWLPSANLVYSLTPKTNIRMGYSKTTSRADFRERSPFIYYEFKERNTYRGAVNLEDASISNVDLRYEYFPGPGEVISVSAFYKKFESPVEIVASQGSPGLVYFYFNLQSSTNRGVEIDMRKSLGFLAPGSHWLKNVFLSANGSWIKANVRYNVDALIAAGGGLGANPGTSVLPPNSRERPLQGLSPYVINGGLGYFGEKFGINAVYNRYGRRIVNGGFFPIDDQYENPRDVIDVQLTANLMKKRMQVKFNISDLLQQDYVIYRNVGVNGGPASSGGGGINADNETRHLNNPNNDPKGLGYNKDLDYTYHRWFRGRNLSLNLTYNF